ADVEARLDAYDLARWSEGLRKTGRLVESLAPLERAVAAHAASGESRAAARAALRLALSHLDSLGHAVAAGWHRRALAYLEGSEPRHETGLALWVEAKLCRLAGAAERALERAAEARHTGA